MKRQREKEEKDSSHVSGHPAEPESVELPGVDTAKKGRSGQVVTHASRFRSVDAVTELTCDAESVSAIDNPQARDSSPVQLQHRKHRKTRISTP